MLTAEFTVSIHIDMRPVNVFECVSDLTRHSEWADSPIEIRALTLEPIRAGSRYQSTAEAH
jgi:hypothetical protein